MSTEKNMIKRMKTEWNIFCVKIVIKIAYNIYFVLLFYFIIFISVFYSNIQRNIHSPGKIHNLCRSDRGRIFFFLPSQARFNSQQKWKILWLVRVSYLFIYLFIVYVIFLFSFCERIRYFASNGCKLSISHWLVCCKQWKTIWGWKKKPRQPRGTNKDGGWFNQTMNCSKWYSRVCG